MRRIGIGDLRERITIRRQSNVKNAATGGLTRTWSAVAEVWASVRSINAREAVVGSVLQGISHFQIIVRYREDIHPSDQIIWRGRELNAHSAEDTFGDRKWTTIHASTEAPQGSAGGA